MPFETFKQILKNQANIEDVKGKEYILLKLISFGDIDKAEKLNRFLFSINQDIIDSLIFFEVQELKRFPKWIRKRKLDDLDKLIIEYCRKFGIDRKELEYNYEIIRKIVESDLKRFLHEFGGDENLFKKFGVELKKAKPKDWVGKVV